MSRAEGKELATLAERREREWLIPSAAMTALLGATAVALMPAAGYSEVPPYFLRLVVWTAWSLIGAMILALFQLTRLRRAGEGKPVAALWAWLRQSPARTLAAAAGMLLAGVDLIFFMWIKPEVTAIAPFWADELFADMDKAIFGRDPWLYFAGMDLKFHAWAYSFFWFIAIMSTLLWLFVRPASRERSAALVNYFALWSIFGPIGQYFGSSAGPIFYQRIGLGDRFAELGESIPRVTNSLSNYLWYHHSNHLPAVGAGISAMPSLHIATVAWVYLVFRTQRSKLAPFAAAFALYIFVLSVALGWHYAVDGIAGALGAIAFQWLSERYFESRTKLAVIDRPAIAAE